MPDAEKLTRLYVVRHGETVWNFQGRWQGWQDSELTELGQQQAARAAGELQDSGAVALYSSDAGRALQTATIIGEKLGLTAIVDQGFRERYYGEFEGRTSDEIDAQFPGTRYEPGRDLRETWRPVGGETLVEVTARVMASIRMVADEHPGESVIIVTHGGVLRVLDGVASRKPLDEIWDHTPANCAIFVLDANLAGDLKIVQHFAEFQE